MGAGHRARHRAVGDVRSNFAIRTVKAPGPLPLGHLA